jgi:hypothetical protein
VEELAGGRRHDVVVRLASGAAQLHPPLVDLCYGNLLSALGRWAAALQAASGRLGVPVTNCLPITVCQWSILCVQAAVTCAMPHLDCATMHHFATYATTAVPK